MNVLLHMQRARKRTGGASISTWDWMQNLADRGHAVRALAVTGRVQMRPGVPLVRGAKHYDWADVVVTHSGALIRSATARKALANRKSVVSIVRGAVGTGWIPPACHGLEAGPTVWGSRTYLDHAQQAGTAGNGPHHVMVPPIARQDYAVRPGKHVTLIGLTKAKGVDLFRAIAETMPDVPFLAVHSGWAKKEQQDSEPFPKNVTVMDYQRDARNVYRQTRILLFMRGADAGPEWLWGIPRVAVEASMSGIPVISHGGEGVREALGIAPTYLASHNVYEWCDAIRETLDEWSMVSALSSLLVASAEYPTPARVFDEAEAFLRSLL